MLRDCFADEIAIDFPSVGRAVQKMRAAFLDERDEDDVARTEVSLSSREASSGMVVPFEISIRGTCPECGGRGETWTERCEGCHGTGGAQLRQPFRVSVPAGVADGARFRFRVSSPHAAPVRVEVRVVIRSAANESGR